jgi:hypothetical protein
MKFDKRTRDIIMYLSIGILAGMIVYFIQKKFLREGYEGEEGEDTEETEEGEETEETEEGDEMAQAMDEGDEIVNALIAESQDVGEEEIDEFEEDLAVSKALEDLDLPGADEMDEEETGDEMESDDEESDDEEEEEPKKQAMSQDAIAQMAQEAIMGQIMSAMK